LFPGNRFYFAVALHAALQWLDMAIILENAVGREKDVQAIDLDSVMKKKRAALRWSPYW
jgi:hypothetical protein